MFSSPMKDDSSEDPTSILRVLGDFQSKMNRSKPGTSFGSTVPQRLRFDDSAAFEDSPVVAGTLGSSSKCRRPLKRSLLSSATRSLSSLKRNTSPILESSTKVARMDPLEGLDYALENPLVGKRQRYPSAEEVTAMKAELERVKAKLVQKEADCMNAEANAKKSEALVKKMQLQVQREAIENEDRVAKIRAEGRKDKDRLMYLEDTIESKKERLDASRTLVDAQVHRLTEANEILEERCQQLTESKEAMQRNYLDLETEVNVFRIEEREEVLSLKRSLREAEDKIEVLESETELRESAISQMHELQRQLDESKTEIDSLKQQRDELKSELNANENATVERRALRRKMDHYPTLVKENRKLTDMNKLLMDTADNNSLLQAQLKDVKTKLLVAEEKGIKGLEAEEALSQAEKKLNKWEGLCQQVLSEKEIQACCGIFSVHMLAQKISELQQSALQARVQVQDVECRSKVADDSVSELHDKVETLTKELHSSKLHVDQQASIIKRFKRKLLLVSKERDSFKGVLESYEHELTFTGGQFEKDRLNAMEDVVSNHKQTIESLEMELAKAIGVESIHADHFLKQQSSKSAGDQSKNDKEFVELKQELQKVLEEKEDLKHELERRAIKGDYDPTSTRVLHFRQNPTDIARDEHAVGLDKLQNENDSLKARVKLLEEGHSANLTMLVGQKVDEAASSQEVQDLREQIKSKDLQRQRLIEAFQTTSQSFREVCCQLTGYRIDALQTNNQYKLTPTYAESNNDYLLFQREDTGECLLLETPFSTQLTELMELHLGQQNSIPVFLSAVIMDLFSRHTFDTHSMAEPTEANPLELQPMEEPQYHQLEPVEPESEEMDSENSEPEEAGDDEGSEPVSDVEEEESAGETVEESSEESADQGNDDDDDDDDDDIVCID